MGRHPALLSYHQLEQEFWCLFINIVQGMWVSVHFPLPCSLPLPLLAVFLSRLGLPTSSHNPFPRPANGTPQLLLLPPSRHSVSVFHTHSNLCCHSSPAHAIVDTTFAITNHWIYTRFKDQWCGFQACCGSPCCIASHKCSTKGAAAFLQKLWQLGIVQTIPQGCSNWHAVGWHIIIICFNDFRFT